MLFVGFFWALDRVLSEGAGRSGAVGLMTDMARGMAGTDTVRR
jgi:hypothetical protein